MKVVIVDDNEQNLYYLEVLLKSEKYEVVRARDGSEALEQLKKDSFSLVISDILMPRMDGFQLCRECKVDPHLKDIPFIFYTATYTDQKDEEFGLSLGADRFVIKPIEPQKFLAIIREVIKEHEKGALTAEESPVKEEELYLAEYNKRLIQKLEKKMLDLEVAHEALAKSEEKYRSIFENAMEGIFQATPDGRYISVNPALARMYGYDSPEEMTQSITRTQAEPYVHPEDRIRLKSLYEEKGYVEAFEVELYKKDKSRMWVSMNGRAVRDEAGKILYYEGIVQDVTDRKRGEEVVRCEREKLEMVTQNIGAGLALISKDYRTLWANQVLKQIFGDVEGKPCYSTYNQRAEICPRCGVQEVFEKGSEKAVHQQEGKDSEGNTIWSEIIATPVKDKDGDLMAALELVVPITERKRMEEAVRESGEKYRTLVEQSLQGSFVIQEMRIVFSNQAFANMGGYTLEELYSLSPEEVMNIIHPDDQERIWGRYREKLEGKPLPLTYNELRAFRKDGRIASVEYDAVRINYMGRPAVLVSVVDITKRREAEKALRESEQRYRQLAESAQDFIFIIDKEGKVQYVNSSAAKEFGGNLDQILGRSVTELFLPETSKRQWDQFQKVIQSGHALPNIEVKVVFPTREVWLNTLLVPLRTENGEVTQVLGIARDLTERKQAEEALRESETRYRQLSEENARLLEQAQQDAQTKTTLLHEVNHRVKNNLTSIIGLIQTQERFRKRKDSLEFRSMCRDLTSRIQGLATVHTLLSSAGWSSVKLTDLATEVIHSALEPLPPDQRASVYVSPSSTQVSPDQANTLALVINELATNTIKHGRRGRQAPSISVRVEETDGQILLEYRDSGPGYPEPMSDEEHFNVGLHLVTNLVRRDLRGEVTLRNDDGAVTRIQFEQRRS